MIKNTLARIVRSCSAALLLSVVIHGWFAGVPTAVAAQAVTISLNGERLETPVEPRLSQGRILVPARAVFEKVGASVRWDERLRRVEIATPGRRVLLPLGSDWAQVNDRFIALDVPAGIIDGRTLVPLRFVAETIGAGVHWRPDDGTVLLTTGSTQPDAGPMPSPERTAMTVTAQGTAGNPWLSLAEAQALSEAAGWSLSVDAVERTLRFRRGDDRALMIADVPVAERNGTFVALTADAVPATAIGTASTAAPGDADWRIPLAMFEIVFGWEIEPVVAGAENAQEQPPTAAPLRYVVRYPSDPSPWPQSPAAPEGVDALIDALRPLQAPIRGARATFADSQVAGAPRPYRNGVHEGFDWYGGVVGVPVTPDTPVRALRAGVVVRADHDWRTPSAATRQAWLAASARSGETPAWILDLLRGRQVWVLHGDGILARYVHLSSVAAGLQPGTRVEAGQILGTAGNSGTSDEVAGRRNAGVHLHLDVLIAGENPWLRLSPAQQRAVWSAVMTD